VGATGGLIGFRAVSCCAQSGGALESRSQQGFAGFYLDTEIAKREGTPCAYQLLGMAVILGLGSFKGWSKREPNVNTRGTTAVVPLVCLAGLNIKRVEHS
jgi:hypothetical protein